VAGPAQAAIRAALRPGRPLSLDELLAEVPAAAFGKSRNPRQTLRNVLANDPLCQSVGRGRYAYLPAVIRGAAVRVAMDQASPRLQRLAVDADVAVLLWPRTEFRQSESVARLALAGGPTIDVSHSTPLLIGLVQMLELPPPFWEWWATHEQAGADAVVVRSLDGEAQACAVEPARSAEIDPAERIARNERLGQVAAQVLKTTRGMDALSLARRLLAQGAYHPAPPPDSLRAALLRRGSPFYLEPPHLVVYHPSLTPALWHLFGDRLADAPRWVDEVVRDHLELPAPFPPEPSPPPAPEPQAAPGEWYRLKVTLQWAPDVWRVIEIRADQALEDLHYAIQRAFGWDDDHIYSFFLSGRAWDRVTEVARPFPEAEPPMADEVLVADLDLKVGQRFLYLFDYGDELRHDVEVEAILPPGQGDDTVRIVERHGQASPQYPMVDEDDDEWGEDNADDAD
jgi:hypothetical protein